MVCPLCLREVIDPAQHGGRWNQCDGWEEADELGLSDEHG
jgi:hypothetical protein